MNVDVLRVDLDSPAAEELACFAENCSWVAGKHMAGLIRQKLFEEWESMFFARYEDRIIGYCTIRKTDYYPENKYSPWISGVFVDENYRGHRVSQRMINFAEQYAKTIGFHKVYIPSGMIGFYEKYGYTYLDDLVNYAGDIEHVFYKEL